MHAMSVPAARLRMIKQRLARVEEESASVRLVTVVAAVEALARSLVVHSSGRPSSTAEMRYKQFRSVDAIELVEEVLRLRGAPKGVAHFGADTWERFELADQYRDLLVHECASMGPDTYEPLIAAAENILEALVELSGIPRLVS